MRKTLLLFSLVLLFSGISKAQIAQLQALYIYNFAKNIGWPVEDSNKDFVITVIGDNQLATELNKLAATKSVGSRKVVVKELTTANGLQKSEIVYLGESKSNQMTNLITAHNDNKYLIVSGKKGHCAQGAGISFLSEGGKLKYEISNRNISKRGLQVSQKMLSLGIAVD